jgi:hypothetical protein
MNARGYVQNCVVNNASSYAVVSEYNSSIAGWGVTGTGNTNGIIVVTARASVYDGGFSLSCSGAKYSTSYGGSLTYSN